MENRSDYSAFEEFANKLNLGFTTPFERVVEYVLGKFWKAVKRGRLFDMLIFGDQGMGKSTMALYLMYKFYGDPGEVLRNVFFNVDDLIETLLNEKRRVILLDDAGITLSKYKALSEPAIDYYSLQQIARTRVNVIIYTTVFDNLAKFIRDIINLLISLHTDKDEVVAGTVYLKKIKIEPIVYKKFDFEMNFDNLHQDQSFHNLYVEYNKRREKFVEEVIRGLLEKKKARKEKEEVEKFELKMERARREAENDFISKIDELMNSLKS